MVSSIFNGTTALGGVESNILLIHNLEGNSTFWYNKGPSDKCWTWHGKQASTLRKSTRQKVHTSHWGGQQRWIDVWNGMVEFQLRSMTKLQKPNFWGNGRITVVHVAITTIPGDSVPMDPDISTHWEVVPRIKVMARYRPTSCTQHLLVYRAPQGRLI